MNITEIWMASLIEKGSRNLVNINIVHSKDDLHREHYLGISTISGCPRSLFFNFNEMEELNNEIQIDSGGHTPRQVRIFRLGHVLEDEIVSWINEGGGVVTGTQDEFSDFSRMFRGHCDGILNGRYILEIKTMKDEKWEDFVSNKIKNSHFSYYIQINMYMYYAGLKEGFIISYNKNTSEIHVEHLFVDLEAVAKYRRIAVNIVTSKTVDTVLMTQEDKDKTDCTFCSYINMCNTVKFKREF